jgi:hypothetical protein
MNDMNAIAIRDDNRMQRVSAEDFMPVLSVQQAIDRKEMLNKFISKVMHLGEDYGTIPGTNNKKVLLKPGAEKLCSIFGLSPRYNPVGTVEDWTGVQHGGEPLFYYEYCCQLWRGDRIAGEGIGSCNSWESKYRWRNASRKCPACGKETIIQGKKEYGGGFLCFAKKGGCGAKYADGDQAIIGQEVGRLPNPDFADIINTCQKMGQKRSLIAAVLVVTNCSDAFTQDMEDFADEPPPDMAAVAARRIEEVKAQPQGDVKPIEDEVAEIWRKMGTKPNLIMAAFEAMKVDLVVAMGNAPGESEYYHCLKASGVMHSNEFVKGPKASTNEARMCIRRMWLILQDAKALNVTQEDVVARAD